MPTVLTAGDEIQCGATRLIVNLSTNTLSIALRKNWEEQMTEKVSIAIIGGSGLYHMDGLQDTKEYNVDTPFGTPSAPIAVGTLENTRVASSRDMGSGHHLTPGEIPYRANIYGIEITRCGTRDQHQRMWLVARRLCTRSDCNSGQYLR